jgi:hypothetical protein
VWGFMSNNSAQGVLLVVLMVWFSSPSLLLGAICQVVFFKRRHAGFIRAVVGLITSSIFIVVGTIALTIALPPSVSGFPPFQGPHRFWFIPSFFFPAYLAGFLVVPLISWLVVRAQPLVPPEVQPLPPVTVAAELRPQGCRRTPKLAESRSKPKAK